MTKKTHSQPSPAQHNIQHPAHSITAPSSPPHLAQQAASPASPPSKAASQTPAAASTRPASAQSGLRARASLAVAVAAFPVGAAE